MSVRDATTHSSSVATIATTISSAASASWARPTIAPAERERGRERRDADAATATSSPRTSCRRPQRQQREPLRVERLVGAEPEQRDDRPPSVTAANTTSVASAAIALSRSAARNDEADEREHAGADAPTMNSTAYCGDAQPVAEEAQLQSDECSEPRQLLAARSARRRARRTRLRAMPSPRSSSSGPAHTIAPLRHHRDVVAQPLDELHHVAREHDRRSRRREVLEQGADRARRHRIDRLERLVEEQQPRAVQQRGREHELLAHAVAVVDDERVGRVGEPEQVEELLGAVGRRRAGPCCAARRGTRAARGRSAVRTARGLRAARRCGPWPRPGRPTRRCRRPRPGPRSGRSSPVAMRSVVVLPAPFGPDDAEERAGVRRRGRRRRPRSSARTPCAGRAP